MTARAASRILASRSVSLDGSVGATKREIAGVVLLALGTFLSLGLLSFQFGDGTLVGPLGRWFARSVFALVGVAAYCMGAALVVMPVRAFVGTSVGRGLGEWAGYTGGLLAVAILLHLVAGGYRVDGFSAGGLLGEYTAEFLRAGLSTTGTALLAFLGLTLALIATTPLEARHIGVATTTLARLTWKGTRTAGLQAVRGGGRGASRHSSRARGRRNR